MRLTPVFAVLLVLGFAAPELYAEETYKASFDQDSIKAWTNVSGKWEVADGKLSQKATGWARYMILAPVILEQGVITARMRADDKDKTSGSSFGFVLRYPPAKGKKKATWSVLRLGAYGGVNLMQPAKDGRLGRFTPEIGRTYTIKVEIKDGKAMLYIDGKQRGAAVMTDPKPSGPIGLYTECRATFESLEVAGKWRPVEKAK